MAQRDMIKTAEKVKGTIAEGYDITATELITLAQLTKEQDLLEVLLTAFRYGYELGCRATKAGKHKKHTNKE